MTKLEATQEWVNNLIIPNEDDSLDSGSIAESFESSSSVVESSDGDFHTETESDDEETITTKALGTQEVPNEVTTITLRELLNSINSVQTVGNINIENSTGVHIGNITNITGNIQIIHTGNGVKRNSWRKGPPKKSKSPATEEREERISRDAFLDHIPIIIPKELCSIVSRCSWLAQQPMEEYEYIKEPLEYIVVSHTATESSEKEAKNKAIIRDIQCFHIESREWNDIAYNFLIGCDGNVYEGRGWGVVGAHTKGYNGKAIGISFIGCFMRVLPSKVALNAFMALMEKGVKEGHIAGNYKLICHCQCRPTESPGRRLFEEIKKWDHFYNIAEEFE